MKTNTSVDSAINAMIKRLLFASIRGWNVLKNETEVNAAPITEVIAAAHITIPKILYPTIPAAF